MNGVREIEPLIQAPQAALCLRNAPMRNAQGRENAPQFTSVQAKRDCSPPPRAAFEGHAMAVDGNIAHAAPLLTQTEGPPFVSAT